MAPREMCRGLDLSDRDSALMFAPTRPQHIYNLAEEFKQRVSAYSMETYVLYM